MKSSHEMILGLLNYRVKEWESKLSILEQTNIQGTELEIAVQLAERDRLRKRVDMMQSLIEELQKP